MTVADTSTSSGDPYGFYTDPVGIDGSAPWITPSDLTTDYTLRFITTDAIAFGSGSNATTAAYADDGPVPVELQYFTVE